MLQCKAELGIRKGFFFCYKHTNRTSDVNKLTSDCVLAPFLSCPLVYFLGISPVSVRQGQMQQVYASEMSHVYFQGEILLIV